MNYAVGYEMTQPVDDVYDQIDPTPEGNGLASQPQIKIQLFPIYPLH
jgi:hypothetical protein